MSHTEAKRDGYYQGYQHGLKNEAFKPNPAQSDRMSLHVFLEAYEQGYDRARSDRALMLKGREDSQQVQSRERDAQGSERGR